MRAVTAEIQRQKRELGDLISSQQSTSIRTDNKAFDSATAAFDKAYAAAEQLKYKTEEVDLALANLIDKFVALKNTDPGTEARANAMAEFEAATKHLNIEIEHSEEVRRRDAAAAKAQADAKKAAADAEREEIAAQRQKNTMLRQLNTMLAQCEAAQRKYAAAAKLGIAKDDYSKLQGYVTQIRQMENALRSGGSTAKDLSGDFDRLRLSISDTTTALKTNTNLIGRWATTGMQQLKSRLTYSFGLAAMVYKAANEIKKMVSTAVELDSAMNQLQIVTRSSGAEMDTYAKRVSSMAKETAQATKDLIDATTVYARLGYSMDESASLAKYTAMLQGVGNIEASAAQDAMTAILKAFNKNVEDVEDIMNKMVVVGNNFPISVSQIAEGMNNAGSMLAVAGNTLEESIALLTASNATVQNISKASTGLRTIAARIRKTTTEEDDGEAINEAKYEEMLGILTKHQVTLTDINGEYRSTYDVMKDIAGIWDRLTSMEKAAVTEALAGTRQQNIFSSVVTQFKDAENAMTSMTDSAGELEEAYGIYLDSIQAHVNQLKAAYDALARDFVDSSVAKGAIDALKTIVELLDALINNVGVLPTLLGGIGIFELATHFSLIKDAISGLDKAMHSVMEANKNGAWLFPKGSMLSSAATSVSALLPVLGALAVALGTFGAVYYAQQQNSFEKALEDAEKYKKKAEELSTQLETNTNRINELNAAKASGDFTTQQQTELSILEAQNEVLKAQIENYEKQYEIQKNIAAERAKQAAADMLSEDPSTYNLGVAKSRYQAAEKRYNEAAEKYKANPDSWLAKSNFESARKNLDNAGKSLNNVLENARLIAETLDEEESAELIEALNDEIIELSDSISGVPKKIAAARRQLTSMQTGGNVDLLNRPVIMTEYLKNAGWEDAGEGAATLFTSTFSNEAGNIAMNFTPIITDEKGNYKGVMSPDELQEYAEAVIAGVREDDLGLQIGVAFEGSDAIEQANAAAEEIHKLQEIIFEDDVKKVGNFRKNLEKLSDNTLQKLIKAEELTESETEDLVKWMDDCEYSVQDVVSLFEQYAGTLDDVSSSGVTAQTSKLIGDLVSQRDELKKTTDALEEYNKALEGGEKDDAVKKMAEIYKSAMEDIKSGRIDTNGVHAAMSLFFSDEYLASIGYDLNKAAERLGSDMFSILFDPEGKSDIDYGQRFAKYVKEHFNMSDGVWMDGNQFFYNSLADVAKAFGMSEDAAEAFISALDMYGVSVMRSNEDNRQLIEQFKEIESKAGSAQEALRTFIMTLFQEGNDTFGVSKILEELNNAGAISVDKTEFDRIIAEVWEEFKQIDNSETEGTIKVDDEATSRARQIRQNLENTFKTPIYQTIRVRQDSSGTGSSSNLPVNRGRGDSQGGARAAGGVTGKAGPVLVNELGPELISDRGRAFIANSGKPGFVNLSKDAIVFTAAETKEISRQSGRKGLIGRLLGRGTGSAATGKWKCNICGYASNSQTDVKCKNCGSVRGATKASTSTNNNYQQMKTCKQCGASIKASLTVCPYCRKNPNVSPSVSDTKWTCLYCGKQNAQTVVKCPRCNTPRGSSTPVAQNTSNTSGKWQCLKCGKYNAQTAVKCSSCGTVRGSTGTVSTTSGSNYNYNLGHDVDYDTSPFDYGDSGGSGGGGGGGADSQSKSNPQKIDWIAVRLNRIQRAVQDLEKIASSGLKKLSTRLDATRQEASKLNELIDNNQQGYNRYMQEAESVGLREDLAAKVRYGTIDIEEFEDEELRQQIQEYQEWYEKALDCASAVEDLNQQIGELYKTNFDLVQADYANKLGLIEHEMNMINADVSMAQAKGMLDSAEFYERLSEQQVRNIAMMHAELTDLEYSLHDAMVSGKIEEGSETWYEMVNAINETKKAIADANVQLQEYQKTVREIKWSYFDYAQERFSQLAQEANFLIGLMSNDKLFQDNGQFNDTGLATLGMRAVNYDAYMAQADEYAKEMHRIEQEMANDPYNKDLIARRSALLQLQQQSIQAAESEKDAVKSLVQEGIQLELESMKKLIDAYKDSLDSAKDLYEYQKKVSEKTADIASIQKQLAAYQGDTSEETRAKVQKLNKDLEKARTDLYETERDQSISDQKKLLDDVYNEYEELLNARLDDVDALMREMIETANANSGTIREEIASVADKVGYIVSGELSDAMSSYANYNYAFEGMTGVTTVLNDIYNNVNAMARAAGAVKAYAKGGLIDYTGLAAVHGSPGNPEMVLSADDTQRFLEAAQMMRSLITAPTAAQSIGSVGTSGDGGIGQVTLGPIMIDHVQDYNDFVRQLQADPKFEKLIDTLTMNRMLGGSRLAKNNIRF